MFRRYRKAVLLLLLILQSCQEMMMISQNIVHLLQLCTPMRRRKVRSVHFHRYHNVIISRVCVCLALNLLLMFSSAVKISFLSSPALITL